MQSDKHADQVKRRGEQSYCSRAMLHIDNARFSRKSFGRKICVERQVGSPNGPSPPCACIHPGRRNPLCTVTRFVGQGAFGEVYQVVWKGVGTDWGSTMAMKTVRLVDVSSDKRDEYRVLLVEEILTVRPYHGI